MPWILPVGLEFQTCQIVRTNDSGPNCCDGVRMLVLCVHLVFALLAEVEAKEKLPSQHQQHAEVEVAEPW